MTNILKSFKLDGQVIIITGGAGLLGKQYSNAIAEAGGIPMVESITQLEGRAHLSEDQLRIERLEGIALGSKWNLEGTLETCPNSQR